VKLVSDFFEELDGLWASVDGSPTAKVRLRLIGSTALMLQTDIEFPEWLDC
jgi:hypothetical protein